MADEPKPSQEVTVRRERAVVEHVQPLFDTGKFEHFQRAATALMNSTLLPPSVRGGSPAECFSNLILVFEMADRFKMPGTSLAQCVSIVHGKMMLEGKVITAMLESTLDTRLQYLWKGERGTPGYRIFVWDKSFDPKDGDITQEQLDALAPDVYPPGARMIDGSVADWQTFQKDSRTPNPAWTGAASRNQLAYRGSREWARLYEPGKMLGVYGDDEIMAWEEGREARALAGPVSGGAISTGFSRPAADPPAQDQVLDAEFVDALNGEAKAQEGAGTADTSPGPDVQGDANTGPTPQQDAPAAPAETKAARRERTEAQKAADQAKQVYRPKPVEEAGGDAVKQNPDSDKLTEPSGKLSGDIDNRPKDPAPDLDAGERTGLAVEAFEDGHHVGLQGGALEVPRTWLEFPDDWTEGWHAGAAERLADAQDDGVDYGEDDEDETAFAGDDDQQPEEPAPASAFDVFFESARGLPTWGEVKAGLNLLSKSDDWKAALRESPAYQVRKARVTAGLRLVELQTQGKEALDIQATDLTAFRCWMETVDDADVILAKWQELVLSPAVEALNTDQRGKMEAAVKARVQEVSR